MTTRRINEVDRMLSHEDGLKRVLGETVKARRRTVRRFGKLEVVIVEETGEPTKVYLTNGAEEGAVVEATANELIEASGTVLKLLADPPPIKRRAR
jgi:hypothetical protein